MRLLFSFCLIIILLDGCIDPFDIDSSISESSLVVDGMITDQPGPYTVKLTYTSSLDKQDDAITNVRGAVVVISDNNGNSETLKEVMPGTYQTAENGIRGVAGNQYRVRITLSDHSVFESEPETLLPSGDIEKIYYEFEQKVDRAEENFIDPKNGFNVYLDAAVLPEQEGLVRWRTTGTWELKTYPELKIDYQSGPGGVIQIVPAPVPCSGYIYVKPKPPPGAGRAQLLYQQGPCKCCECWITQYDDQPLLSDPRFDSEGVTRRLLTFIPASRRLFYAKYHLQVEQMSVSKKNYDFWNTIKKQRQTGSDLFQTPPPRMAGNIRTVSGTEKAFGYFSASSIKVSSFFIEREAIPYYMPPIDTIPESCSAGYKYYTTTKPFFW